MWLSFGQRLGDVVAGCEAAWGFFGGVFKGLIPDNMKPIVEAADPILAEVQRRVLRVRPIAGIRHRPGSGADPY